MTFDEWWATLTAAEQKVIGRTNAKFVWLEACEACAKEVFEMCKEGLWDVEGMKHKWNERNNT